MCEENLESNGVLMTRLDGGKKIIHTSNGEILRYVYEEIDSKKLTVQYNNQMPEVKREFINNTEVFTLIE